MLLARALDLVRKETLTVPTDNTVNFDRDVVLGLNVLPRDGRKLNLDIWESEQVLSGIALIHCDIA